MSVYDEPRWAVLSERGAEATEVTYDQAVALTKNLAGEKIYGARIVTVEAARRFTGEALVGEKAEGRQKRDAV